MVVMGGFIVVLLLAISRQDMNLLSVLAVVPPLVLLVNRPDLWLALIVALWQSMLKFPQAPASLSAFHIFSLGLVILLIPFRMLKTVAHRISPVRKYVWLFGMVLLITALFRGVGIKVLGSPLWGGAPYVVLLIAISLFLGADLLNLSARTWRNALIAMCLLSFFPTFAQLTYVFSGGRIYQQYYFVQPSGFIASTLEAVDSGSGVARFNVSLGSMLLYLPFIFYENPFRRNAWFVSLLLIAVSLVSSSLSGYRSSIISTVLFIVICSTLDSKGFKWKRGVLLGCMLLGVLLLAVAFMEYLPISVQRAISFIPSSNIAWEAQRDAMGTTTWRLEVWARAIRDIPDYLLLGQGFAFNPREISEIMAIGTYDRDWAFVTHSYHHGPLSLILVLGLSGFLVGMGFILSSLREYFRLMRAPWPDDTLGRLFRLVFAQFLTQCLIFATIYGDVQVSFPVFFFQAMLLEGMAKTRATLLAGPEGDLNTSGQAIRTTETAGR